MLWRCALLLVATSEQDLVLSSPIAVQKLAMRPNFVYVLMDDVAKQVVPITREVLEEACRKNPTAVGEKLRRWKHLYRALEKLTDGEAAKVISTVREENGFEAWRQLHLRFEPELEAQKNVVLLWKGLKHCKSGLSLTRVRTRSSIANWCRVSPAIAFL